MRGSSPPSSRGASFTPGLGMGAPRDQDFSRKLAARGWLGMALPRRYGGRERSVVERFVVVEELLRWGAPVGYHWVADRQTGPLIARFGSARPERRFLPAICRGELSFSIGMSEPEAGSDLAAVQTRATRVDGGWRVSGTKIWTGGAHENDWFVVLCRTSDEEDRHAGLTQLIVDLRSPGLTVRPIAYLDGNEFFSEVEPRGRVRPRRARARRRRRGLGAEHLGARVRARRARSGGCRPTSWSSSTCASTGSRTASARTRCSARRSRSWWAIRALSLSVARLIDAGEAPAAESALVKELGHALRAGGARRGLAARADVEPALGCGSLFERLLAAAILMAPSFTIRGGTNEILRSVAARALRG